ncbi:hypothetical protein SASPL_147158 [Salvia splendens]|uniref:Retrotransposon gag domain-containing protein n=1 Tax=Salvia splendens TaxID=180675 RepID=A0A8X8WEN4_SALSN|nr:hypothetical protein SASPL_147158 [Salvia splendens]
MAPLPGKHGVILCTNAVDTGIIPFLHRETYAHWRPVPAGYTSEDYRLKAISFVLKGEAGVWLSRLPEGQEYDEPLGQYWDRFQGLLQECPKHKLAKNIMERLIEAKRWYETSRGQYRRWAVHVAEACNDEKLEARFEQMEKKLLEAEEKAKLPPPPAPKETQYAPPPPSPEEHHYYYCEFPPEAEPQA